jgi:hypothetical protein
MSDGFSGSAHTQITPISITRKHSLHIWNSNECITTGNVFEEDYNTRSKHLNVYCVNASKLKVLFFSESWDDTIIRRTYN